LEQVGFYEIYLLFSLKRDIEHEQRVTNEIETWLLERRVQLKSLHRHWSERLVSDVATADRALAEVTQARETDLARKAEVEARLSESEAYVAAVEEKRERDRIRRERLDLEIRTAIRIQVVFNKKNMVYF